MPEASRSSLTFSPNRRLMDVSTPQTLDHCIFKGHALIVTYHAEPGQQMKSTIVAIMLALLGQTVLAGNYSEAAARESYCSQIGNTTVSIYDARVARISKQTLIDMAEKKDGDKPIDPSMQFSIAYGYDVATSQRDAYLAGWAYCMDKTAESKTSASATKKKSQTQSSSNARLKEIAHERSCDEFGTYMVAAFDRKDSPEYRKKISEILAEDAAKMDGDAEFVRVRSAYRLAVNYSLNKAKSRKDAYMTATKYCVSG
jgi:hypothetical protein